MAIKLNLTRDQFATFLKNHEQIKQFEKLFEIVDQVSPSSDTPGIEIQAGNADASANEALAQIVVLAKDSAINASSADQKAVQALDTLGRIANALEMLATAPVIQNNNSVVTDYIDLPEDGPHVTQARRVQWNQDDGTVDVGLYGGSVLQVGQEMMFYAKNTSGSLIPNGTPVMFTGTVGSSGKLTFGLAVADGSVPADYMMGVTTQDVANNAFGYVTNFGLVRGFNTTGAPYGETWADGDLLYFDPATPGTWTNVQPAAPNIHVPVAVVVNAGSGGSGSIFVRMTVAESLSRLQDVYINGTGTPNNGDILIYDSADSRWENKAQSLIVAGRADNLSGGAAGSVPYQTAPNVTGMLAIAPANAVLTSSGTAPQWSTGLALSSASSLDVNSTSPALRITQTGTGAALLIEDSTSPDATPFLIDGNGVLVKGATTAVDALDYGGTTRTFSTQVQGNQFATAGILQAFYANVANGAPFVFAKSRSSTVGAHTTVQNGDLMMVLLAEGSDGTAFVRGAHILAEVDGTPASGVMPGKLFFGTTSKAGGSPVNRVAIDSNGMTTLGANAASGTALSTTVAAKLYSSTLGYTDTTTAASGVVAHGTANSLGAIPIAATNTGVVYTNASTLYIGGAPTAGSNVTITNPFALFIESGAARFGGNAQFLGNVDLGDAAADTITSNGYLSAAAGLQISKTGVTAPAASDGNVYSGTYTPTVTAVTNVAAVTAVACQYMRVGNVVTVSGQVRVDPTAAGNTVFGMTLPIASNFANTRELAGTFATTRGGFADQGAVVADTTNDRANFQFNAVDLALTFYAFHFTYQII
jgi:hypothetical protein